MQTSSPGTLSIVFYIILGTEGFVNGLVNIWHRWHINSLAYLGPLVTDPFSGKLGTP